MKSVHLPGVAWHNRVPASLAVRLVVPVTYGMVSRKEAFTTWELAGNVGADVIVSWFARQSTVEQQMVHEQASIAAHIHHVWMHAIYTIYLPCMT
jgi:hypothetical protein